MQTTKYVCVAIVMVVLLCVLYYTNIMSSSKEIQSLQFTASSAAAKISATNSTNSHYIPVWYHDLSGSWRQRHDICTGTHQGTLTTLKTPFGNLPIHVHDPKTDIWVSRRIVNSGRFDSDKINVISQFLTADPTLNFIDIGANLGVYSLSFAKMGRKVLAIDALNLNIEKLCASVNSSHLGEKVFMVMNAVSSQHETVSLAADEKNFGGTFIDQNADFVKHVKGKTVSVRHYNNISTIVLDDLLTLPFISMFSRVFIKMDIEGFEHKALERAFQFFGRIFVRGIQIEWIFHRNKPSGQIIVSFLERRSFTPYNPLNLRPFRKSSMGNWQTQDVLWLRH